MDAFVGIAELLAAKKIDRNQDSAADDGQDEKDVAAHLREANEKSSIQADRINQLLLLGIEDGPEPSE